MHYHGNTLPPTLCVVTLSHTIILVSNVVSHHGQINITANQNSAIDINPCAEVYPDLGINLLCPTIRNVFITQNIMYFIIDKMKHQAKTIT